jgi:drug/metabolite transporter (DMT)-like permease
MNSLFRSPIIPALFLVLLSTDVAVMIFEKMGAAAAGNALGNELGFYFRLIQLPWTWMVIILSPIQLLTWSKILSKTELSIAYPVSSLCFPLTMITSAIVFHEHVTSLAWLGGIILSAGIAIVGSEKEHPSQMETQELDKQNPESARVPAMASNKSGGSERD